MSAQSDKIIYRASLSDKKKELISQVNSLLNLTESGVYILFDDADYPKYLNKIWSNKAVFLNIKLGGVEEMSPSHILEIMEKDDCQYFIWISKRVCDSDDVNFTWIFSHELQHLRQETDFPKLSGVGDFLRRALGQIEIEEPKLQTTIPTEYDADRAAKYVTIKIFGSSVCEQHIEKEINSGTKRDCFKVIKKIDLTKPYDVVAETLNLILKYRDQIRSQKFNSSENDLIHKFDIEAFISHYSTK